MDAGCLPQARRRAADPRQPMVAGQSLLDQLHGPAFISHFPAVAGQHRAGDDQHVGHQPRGEPPRRIRACLPGRALQQGHRRRALRNLPTSTGSPFPTPCDHAQRASPPQLASSSDRHLPEPGDPLRNLGALVLLFGLAIVFNDYFYAFAFVSDENAQTLVAAVGSTSIDISDSGFTFAAVTIGVAPVAVLCAFFADVYARGLGAGVID